MRKGNESAAGTSVVATRVTESMEGPIVRSCQGTRALNARLKKTVYQMRSGEKMGCDVG